MAFNVTGRNGIDFAASQRAYFDVYNGSSGMTLFAIRNQGAGNETVASITCNASTMKWLRFRERAGIFFWDYSADERRGVGPGVSVASTYSVRRDTGGYRVP